ncbi:MAG: hypothetical protein DRP42_04930, partial [Tenericutes bacterium]
EQQGQTAQEKCENPTDPQFETSEWGVATFDECKEIGHANCEALGLDYIYVAYDDPCCYTNCKDEVPDPIYTNSECFYLKDEYGRTYHHIVENENACTDYVFTFCDSAGMTGWLTNFLPTNCCLFDCKVIT